MYSVAYSTLYYYFI